ncbi:MAG: hypothetical protein LRZ85_04035 [Alphaproteobacteria bacterium]|nr:hypothetical protein [Alphaproteobacteria bacterium]MCD8520377.1 hypothetical protein [Alphaproteobacteria bacterium]MCD8526303.1 hypothetical protein [Alphaproteobacteria bacterium]MCD8570065.1 hypothetical protein [Alphaproteobacteria bacterium]
MKKNKHATETFLQAAQFGLQPDKIGEFEDRCDLSKGLIQQFVDGTTYPSGNQARKIITSAQTMGWSAPETA